MRRYVVRFFSLLLLLLVLELTVVTPKGMANPDYYFKSIDDTGNDVRLPHCPKRIVSLAPSMTEILFAVGAGDQLVGVSDLCNYPASVEGLSRVAGINLRTEQILALRPELVLAHAGLHGSQLEELRRLGLRVAAYSPENWRSVLRVIQITGEMTGHKKKATYIINNMEIRRKSLAKSTGSKRPRVFVEIGNTPLMTAGPKTFLHELIQFAGGENIAGSANGSWVVFPAELVLARDPQIILLTWNNVDEVMNRPGWKNISAVKNGRLFQIEPDIYTRPGPRLIQALENLTDIINGIGGDKIEFQ